MMKRLLLCPFMLLCAAPIVAQIPRVSVGPQLSSLGIGGSASLGGGGFFSVSLEAGFIPVGDLSLTEGDIDYTASPDIAGGVLAVSLHPLRNRFSVGVGVLVGGYKASVESESLSGTVEVGGMTYEVSDVGTLTGDFKLQGPGPVLLAGWRGKGFNFGAGVAFLGTPEVDLGATGRLRSDPTFQRELQDEEDQIRDDLNFSAIPFFRIGYQLGL